MPKDNPSPSVTIIIVSYNTKDILIDCLKSVLQQPSQNITSNIIIVDNASTDGTLEHIHNHFPQVKCIQNQQNIGFARANNQASNSVKTEYLLFLNSDTLVKENAIQQLVLAAEKEAALLATCRLLTPSGNIQPQGGFLPNKANIFAWMTFLDDIPIIKHLFRPYQLSDAKQFEKDMTLGWISGTAMLIQTKLFHKLGGFDESMFMYGEDVELCLRASNFGIQPRYFATPKIVHLGHQSGSQAHALIGEFRGLLEIFQKHRPQDGNMIKSLLRLGVKLRLLLFSTLIKDDQKKAAYRDAMAVVR